MRLKKTIKEGMFLNTKDIKEMKKMYYSGNYYLREILEWFGITEYEFKCYKDLFFVERKKI